jgi:hypothetical protein
MTRFIYIVTGIFLMSFLTLTELNDSIIGDFDGNGDEEKAWIQTIFPGQAAYGEGQEYIPAQRKVLFSKSVFPEIEIGNASSLYNVGDINKNQSDEILISGSHGFNPFDHPYSVYTFDTVNKAWLKVLDANAPSAIQSDPNNWVFIKNDTVFYWSSNIPDYSATLKDTLKWMVK